MYTMHSSRPPFLSFNYLFSQCFPFSPFPFIPFSFPFPPCEQEKREANGSSQPVCVRQP